MKRFRDIVIVSAIIALSFGVCLYAERTHKVTVTCILDSPNRYVGKRVKVAGYLVRSYEVSALFQDMNTAKMKDVRKAIWVRAGNTAFPDSWEGLVEVNGVFNYHSNIGTGHLGVYPAEIEASAIHVGDN